MEKKPKPNSERPWRATKLLKKLYDEDKLDDFLETAHNDGLITKAEYESLISSGMIVNSQQEFLDFLAMSREVSHRLGLIEYQDEVEKPS